MGSGEAYVAAVLLSGLAFVGGFGMIHKGFKLRRQRELMRDTPTEDVESVGVGPTEVTGAAEPIDGPIRAPFTDEECVVATWEIEEWDESGDSSEWDTVGEGVDHTPFYVDDGTGRLRVEPHDEAEYEVEGDDEPTLTVGATESPPEPVARFLEREDTPDESATPVFESLDVGKTHGDRRYYQRLIEPDEAVYVFGTALIRDEAAPENEANLVVRKAPEDEEPMFMISDRSEEALVADRRWSLWRVPVGAAVSTLGLGGLIVLLGPLVGLDIPLL